MESTFWHDRWQAGQIGFHQAAFNGYLTRHWADLNVPTDAPVLVPLCGKSRDLRWLADRGHRVLGVELSPLACEAFFAEQGWSYERVSFDRGVRYQGVGAASAVALWCADWFALTAADLGEVSAFYDRAALIALPPPMRVRYVAQLGRLLSGTACGLLVTLDYPQAERAGPPFAVADIEVASLFGAGWQRHMVETEDMLARPDAREREWGLARVQQTAWTLVRSTTG